MVRKTISNYNHWPDHELYWSENNYLPALPSGKLMEKMKNSLNIKKKLPVMKWNDKWVIYNAAVKNYDKNTDLSYKAFCFA